MTIFDLLELTSRVVPLLLCKAVINSQYSQIETFV